MKPFHFIIIAIIALSMTTASVTGDDTDQHSTTYYYDSSQNYVGGCADDCGNITCWGQDSDHYMVVFTGPCSPTWQGGSGACIVDGIYFDHCPSLPSGAICPYPDIASDGTCCPNGTKLDPLTGEKVCQ